MASTQVELVKGDTDLDNNKQEIKEEIITENDPNFAVVCSFIDKFGSYLDLSLDIGKLKSMLEASDSSECVFYFICLLHR